MPTDGQLSLAADNAHQIIHDCEMAVRCKTWGGHRVSVQGARSQLYDLARRLGYDLVPRRGSCDD